VLDREICIKRGFAYLRQAENYSDHFVFAPLVSQGDKTAPVMFLFFVDRSTF